MKVGDVVQLKSGGPDMTIREDLGANELGRWFLCEYFEKDILITKDFLESSLVIVSQKNI